MKVRHTKWTRRLLQFTKALLAAAALAIAVYWWWFAPIAVHRLATLRADVVAEVMGTGTLEARVKATISPEISGLITKVLADQGDRVAAGQVLVQLNDDDLSQQVEVAESGLAVTKAALARLSADESRAAAVLAQARLEHRRLEGLASTNAASNIEMDRAIESLRVAEAELARSQAAIQEGRTQVITAEKTLGYQRARLADTVVKAPFDGLIVRRLRDPGDVAVPGTAVLTLVSLNEIWVSAWVDETEMAHLRPDQRARIVFRSEPGCSYPGEVVRLGREADRETREFLVDVRVQQLPNNWAVGQRAEVYIEVAQKQNATVLPARGVIWRDGKPGVFIEAHGRAAWRPLELGLRARESVEVVKGIQPADRVILPDDPTAILSAGRRVSGS